MARSTPRTSASSTTGGVWSRCCSRWSTDGWERAVTRRGATVAMLAILLRGAAAEAQEQVGSVAALEGRAEALHPGQAAWTAVAAHDAVLLGDQLRTLADSKLKLAFRDDSALTLAASSQLTVDEQVRSEERRVGKMSGS